MRYQRQEILPFIGEKGQAFIANSKVLVVGAGGLGCPLLMYLTQAGVGTIGIADGDKVELNNLHRQVLFTENSIGKNKAEEAARLLQERNGEVLLKVFPLHILDETHPAWSQSWDVVVDCTDRLDVRFLIDAKSKEMAFPWVHAAVEGQQVEIAVFGCSVNADAPVYYSDVFATKEVAEIPRFGCSEFGVFGPDPGFAAMIQARETLNILLQRGSPLNGKMLVVDLENYSQYLMTIPPGIA